MLNVENARIVKTLVSDINFDSDSLMVGCVALSDMEQIPGTDAIKCGEQAVKLSCCVFGQGT